MNMHVPAGHACPMCGHKKKAAASKFSSWATRAENLRDHGELAPWQLGKKRPKLERKVTVRVEFADGDVRRHTTFFATKAGEPDADAIVRAERESRMMHAAWAQAGGVVGIGGYERRPRSHDLRGNDGRTYAGLYLEPIPAVTRVSVEAHA